MPSRFEILLRRRHRIIAPSGAAPTPTVATVATLLKSLEPLGFTASPRLIERLMTWSEDDLGRLQPELTRHLRRLLGAHAKYVPMYPNFPEQVMEASEAELYLNALMHYLGDFPGVRILPVYEKKPRPPLADTFDLTVIDLGTDDDLPELARQLIGAKTSISKTDKEDVAAILALERDRVAELLPAEIPFKENLSFVTGELLDHPQAASVLAAHYKTATDVLRLAVALSGGDVSLAAPTRFRSFKRAERRFLLALLEGSHSPLDDMRRHRGAWTRLGERLHAGEYAKRFPLSAAAFVALRDRSRGSDFHAEVEAAFKRKDVDAALARLRTRPGELARRLDHLLRAAPTKATQTTVLEAFDETASQVSTPVLLQILAHFRNRNRRQGPEPARRSFFPKGDVGKVFVVEDRRPRLDRAAARRIVERCESALLERFAERGSLGKVFVDKRLFDYVVPFSQRSSSKALRTLVRGSRLPIPDGRTLRFFLWWKEGVVNGEETGRVDIDLSAGFYGAHWTYRGHISYTELKMPELEAVHSGDITSAPNGACEFIDIDIDAALRKGIRFVVMSVLSYSRHPFHTLPECFAGWMLRQAPKSGEVFEPATVADRIDLAADTRISIPVVIDLQERQIIWADLALRRNPRWHVNLEGNQRGIVTMARSVIELVKPNLYQLFDLHARARGERVETSEEADTVFSLENGVTPFSIEAIMADYL